MNIPLNKKIQRTSSELDRSGDGEEVKSDLSDIQTLSQPQKMLQVMPASNNHITDVVRKIFSDCKYGAGILTELFSQFKPVLIFDGDAKTYLIEKYSLNSKNVSPDIHTTFEAFSFLEENYALNFDKENYHVTAFFDNDLNIDWKFWKYNSLTMVEKALELFYFISKAFDEKCLDEGKNFGAKVDSTYTSLIFLLVLIQRLRDLYDEHEGVTLFEYNPEKGYIKDEEEMRGVYKIISESIPMIKKYVTASISLAGERFYHIHNNCLCSQNTLPSFLFNKKFKIMMNENLVEIGLI